MAAAHTPDPTPATGTAPGAAGSRAPRIAVVGGGPGGLTLARVLETRGIPVTVFERDASPVARQQGGMLDLHEESGQSALRTAGLLDEFLALARPEGEEARIAGADGAALVAHLPEPGQPARPEVDRADLRRLLLASLRPDTVRWGRAVVSAVPAGGAAHRLVFADGTTETFDLVVGADGAWSRVRALLTDQAPVFSGVHFVEARTPGAARDHAALAGLVGPGSLYAFEDDRGIMAQHNGDGTIRTYYVLRLPEEWLPGPAEGPAEHRAETLRKHFDGWNPVLLAPLEHSAELIHRVLYALPAGHRWQHRPGVTLLGDAAHLMTPFAGLGANMAMLDAAELGLSIAGSGDLTEAVRGYEDAMWPRAAGAAALTEAGLAAAISPDAPGSALRHFASVVDAG
ncbi:FAD-dependent monooxygenase [Streptomyces sp. LP05-1]|uniref:Flavin-dependent monooxygenase n=1 Tax=Streptomyces pyxinae TaxID=2970734 RepID=A0ABT2CPW5_9ACTN|nr:NAD(P)/FAD-dependent oxidoreductase [Streptomyces sp. LP05-1]MCS0639478.1 FAD-dependent monooxygenase [Streptomyces sp. LP05-1]